MSSFLPRRTFLQSTGLAVVGGQLAAPALGADTPGANPVAFTVAIRVKPGREAEFLDVLSPVLDAMRHETTFINAVLHRDPEDPSRFLIYETWADLDDVLRVQLHRRYRQDYTERLPGLLAEERDIGVWRPLRSDPASCLRSAG